MIASNHTEKRRGRAKMYDYFEGNYTWNMAVNLALGMGGSIGDIDDVSRPLRAVARNNDDAAAEMWFEAWGGLGAKVRAQAKADEARGRTLSAGEKYRRAAIYLVQAERMQRPGFKPREAAFQAYLDCFAKFVALTGQNCTRVEVPYKSTSLPGLLIKAEGVAAGHRAPAMIHFDGLDVTKEIIFMLGIPQALARRGIADAGRRQSRRRRELATARPQQRAGSAAAFSPAK